MNERLRNLSDIELGAALAEVGAHVRYPETPDLAAAVRARIDTAPARRRVSWSPTWRRVAFAAAVIVVLVAGTLFASPAARRAVADLLGIGGVAIVVEEERGPAPEPTTPAELNLGDAVSLAEGRAQADFSVGVPTSTSLGTPDAVFFSDDVEGGRVSFTYQADENLPAADETGLGALLMQFRADIGQDLIKRVPFEGGRVRPVEVAGAPGFWITGAPHEVYFVAPDGEVRADTVRLAANVLLWERDGVSLRLESDLSLKRALRIAHSVR
ncbi:MAG: hypothetical protein ACRDKB_02850 [Actinomycetota bacterium]